jgi:hypothetical protein
MRAIGETGFTAAADELHPGIMNQGGGLKGMARSFGRKLLLSHTMQFGVHQVEQVLVGALLTAIDSFEEAGYFTHPRAA